jgi:HK97 family phage major capsid protein
MDPKSELASIKARINILIAETKSTGRDLTPAETAEVEAATGRIYILKAAIERGEKNAGLMTQVGDLGGDVETTYPNGLGGAGESTSVKRAAGFITPRSLKSTADRMAAGGYKALVAGGSTVTPVALDSTPLPLGQSGLGLLSLLTTNVRDTEKYSYIAQSLRTNNAAVVAPGAEKPTSIYTVKSVDGALKVYAHLSEPIGKYLLQDNSDLEAFLDAELRNGIVRKVTADGVAAFSNASGIQTQAYAGTAADSIYGGLSKVTSLGYNAALVILPQADYDAIRLSKDSDGRYLGGNPLEGGVNPALWGVTTLVTPDLASGTALVLGEGAAGISTDKAGIVTEWNPFTHFSTNEVLARTEARFAFDVFKPEAIVKVTTKAAA